MNRIPLTLLILFALLLANISSHAAPPDPPATAADRAPASSPDVFFYPREGQGAERQDRDRYECFLWARRQTGYDPSLVRPDLHRPVRVVAVAPPGRDTATGAVAGAVIGASVAHPHDEGRGAVIGAIAGAVLGSAADNSRRKDAEAEAARRNAQRESAAARAEAELQDYRRALRSCLEGRGYSVQ